MSCRSSGATPGTTRRKLATTLDGSRDRCGRPSRRLFAGCGIGHEFEDSPGSSWDRSMHLTAGTRLGVYEIRSLLGAGGMGEVYRARDSKLNRDVAIKV